MTPFSSPLPLSLSLSLSPSLFLFFVDCSHDEVGSKKERLCAVSPPQLSECGTHKLQTENVSREPQHELQQNSEHRSHSLPLDDHRPHMGPLSVPFSLPFWL
jgi:hypothetical protein